MRVSLQHLLIIGRHPRRRELQFTCVYLDSTRVPGVQSRAFGRVREGYNVRGVIWIVMAAVLWGTTGTAQALAPVGATPLTLGALRLLVGAVFLVGVALVRGGFRDWRRCPPLPIVVAGVSFAVYQPAFFGGTLYTGVAVGTVIAIGSAPVFAGLIGLLWQRQPLTRNWFMATGLALVGCTVLVLAGSKSLTFRPVGVLLSLTAGLAYIVYATAMKGLTASHHSEGVVAASMMIGAVLLMPLLLTTDIGWTLSANGVLVVLHLGIAATGLSYLLFGYGVQHVPVTTAATLSLIEPLTATLLGVFVVGESLSTIQVIGMGMIFAGLALLTVQPPRVGDRGRDVTAPSEAT